MPHFQSEEEFQAWVRARELAVYDLQNGKHASQKQATSYPKPHPISRKIPRTEEIYKRYLELQRQAGKIKRYWHEPWKFLLTHGIPHKVNEMSYKIDFVVEFPDHLRCVEVKNNKISEKEDAWVKLKAACEIFPCFEFVKVYVNTKTGEIQEEILT